MRHRRQQAGSAQARARQREEGREQRAESREQRAAEGGGPANVCLQFDEEGGLSGQRRLLQRLRLVLQQTRAALTATVRLRLCLLPLLLLVRGGGRVERGVES